MKHVRAFLSVVLLAAPALSLAAEGTGAAAPPRRPNIVLVLADDLGLSRVGCYGGGPFKTPHLDRLAATGVRFERAYSMPICGPSRAALLTGKYPFRTGAVNNETSVVDPQKHRTLAALLQKEGYVTCAIGKLGQTAPEGDADAPARLGFDESMLWMGRGTPDRYWNPRYYRNGQVVQGKPTDYGPDLTHAFLVDFMRRHREKPFFVYYSAVLTHFPYSRTPDSTDDKRPVEDMVAYFDKMMGRLADDLDKLGLRDNTLLLITSDNGPQGNPLGTVRGTKMVGAKGDVTEGGVRTPLIVNCPKLVPPARVCPDLTDFTDLLPTVLELAGAGLPPDLKLDGRSIAPQVLGRPGRPREWVYAQHGRAYFVADARYKLYGDGRFVDVGDSPVAEKSVPDGDEAAAARKRLAAALAELRAGAAEAPRASPGALRARIPAAPAQRAAQLKADLAVLREHQVIASPEDWLAAAADGGTCDGPQVAALLVAAAGKFKPAGSAAQALEVLREEGVINSASYWKEHAVPGGRCSGDNVARLINKLAARLRAR